MTATYYRYDIKVSMDHRYYSQRFARYARQWPLIPRLSPVVPQSALGCVETMVAGSNWAGSWVIILA